MKKLKFAESMTRNSITLARGYRFVKNAKGKYEVYAAGTRVSSGLMDCYCSKKGSESKCHFEVKGRKGVCVSAGCSGYCIVAIATNSV